MDDEQFFVAIETLIEAGRAFVHEDVNPPSERELQVLAARVEIEIRRRRAEAFSEAMLSRR